jgi:predicted SnoaL-like aldol condensation-catalyzing enzyme
MTKTVEEANKAVVLEAFDTLFNKRDYEAAERFWSPNYIQHSAHIPPGREGLFNLIKSAPPTLRYEHGVILADKELVIVHGRFSGHGRPRSWIAVDIVRIADVYSPSTGTSCKTKQPGKSRKAARLCSARRFLCKRSKKNATDFDRRASRCL